MEPTKIRYEIDSWEKLLNMVTEVDFEGMATDLASFLAIFIKYSREYRKNYPEDDRPNSEIFPMIFVYHPGEAGTREYAIKNPRTGKIETYSIQKEVRDDR